MKRGTLVMTVLVVMAMLFASCSSGLSKDAEGEGASTKTVKVDLNVELADAAQKAITVDDALTGLTFWYKAVPQWSQTRPIAGDTRSATADGFVQIPGYGTGSREIGSFTAGLWHFYVEVRKGATVIYTGDRDYSIYTNHKSIVITVEPDTTGGATGTVTITVSVPTTGNYDDPQAPVYNESIAMTYSGYVDGSPVSGNFAIASTSRGAAPNALTTYTTTPKDLAPGAYTVTILYSDQNGTQNGGASMAVNVLKDQTAEITGQIENGVWHASNLTIKKPGFSAFSVTAASNATYITPTGSMLYTCSATSSSGSTITKKWYVNGVFQDGQTGDTYTFNSGHDRAFGLYEITCVAYDGTDAVASNNTSNGNSLWIAVGNSITCNAASGTGAGTVECARTYATPNEIIVLTVTPTSGTLTGLTVNTVDAMDGYDQTSGKAYVHMPASGNASIDSVFTAAP